MPFGLFMEQNKCTVKFSRREEVQLLDIKTNGAPPWMRATGLLMVWLGYSLLLVWIISIFINHETMVALFAGIIVVNSGIILLREYKYRRVIQILLLSLISDG
jgi:hypothetical protein